MPGSEIESTYAYGHWETVIWSVLFFTAFVVAFLTPIRRREWRSLGMWEAFILALYAEMYGFPLTIYIITSIFGRGVLGPHPFSHQAGHLLGILFLGPRWAMVPCHLGSLLMLMGMIVVILGWWKIYRSRGRLVTDGIYGWVRHPQYLGLILVTVGMLIQWPTIVTLLMWPILLVAYYRLARKEEREMEAKFGQSYRDYKKHTPRFIPFLIFSR